MGIFSKTRKESAPARLSFDEGMYVVIDPADGQQAVYPEAGELYLIENKGIERALYFDRYDGDDARNCQRCSLGKEDSDWAKSVCRKMCCLDPKCDVYGKEYIVDNVEGCYVPKPEFKGDDAPQVDAGQCDVEQDVKEVEPAVVFTSDDERRAAWESALRELETQARAHEVIADDLKTRAKRSQNCAKQLRAKIYELLTKGSENYTSDTPLFDGVDDLDKSEEA